MPSSMNSPMGSLSSFTFSCGFSPVWNLSLSTQYLPSRCSTLGSSRFSEDDDGTVFSVLAAAAVWEEGGGGCWRGRWLLGRTVAAAATRGGGDGCWLLAVAVWPSCFLGEKDGGVAKKPEARRARMGGPTCKMRSDLRYSNGQSVIDLCICTPAPACAPDTAPEKGEKIWQSKRAGGAGRLTCFAPAPCTTSIRISAYHSYRAMTTKRTRATIVPHLHRPKDDFGCVNNSQHAVHATYATAIISLFPFLYILTIYTHSAVLIHSSLILVRSGFSNHLSFPISIAAFFLFNPSLSISLLD
jgi:hypothetical protein